MTNISCLKKQTVLKKKLKKKTMFYYTVQPVLRGHLRNKENKWPYKTGDFLKEVQFI